MWTALLAPDGRTPSIHWGDFLSFGELLSLTRLPPRPWCSSRVEGLHLAGHDEACQLLTAALSVSLQVSLGLLSTSAHLLMFTCQVD